MKNHTQYEQINNSWHAESHQTYFDNNYVENYDEGWEEESYEEREYIFQQLPLKNYVIPYDEHYYDTNLMHQYNGAPYYDENLNSYVQLVFVPVPVYQ